MGWGSSTRRGGGRKVRALPRKLSSLGFEERNLGCPWNFAGMSWTSGVFKKFVHKKIVHTLRSLRGGLREGKRGRGGDC